MVKVLSFSFKQCFVSFTKVLNKGSSKTGLFRHLSNDVLKSPRVQKYIRYEGHLFFKKFLKFSLSLENVKKKHKLFFVSEVIASENVAIN